MSKVWLVNQYALPASGAGGTRHQSLAAAWAQVGNSTTIWAAPNHYASGANSGLEGPVEVRPGVSFNWVGTKAHEGNGLSRILGMLEFAARVLWRGARQSSGPDVVVGSSPNLFAALGAYLLARRWRTQFILEVRDLWPSSVIELMNVKKWHPFIVLLAAIERYLYRRADHIVGLMEGLEAHVASVLGPDHPTVTWIPNGVDLSQYVDGPNLSPPKAPFTLVYAGAHGVPNSLDTALQAMDSLADRSIELHLYGSGVMKDELRQQAAHLPSVVFHDAVPKTEIPRILQGASALLICWRDSPLYSRGVSANKLFDYLASGRPIVQAYSGMADIVTASNGGVSVPAEDPDALAEAIVHLAGLAPEELDGMGAHGKSWVHEHRSIEALADRFLKIFASAATR